MRSVSVNCMTSSGVFATKMCFDAESFHLLFNFDAFLMETVVLACKGSFDQLISDPTSASRGRT